ncbi:MAG: hypothetical protein VB092_09055 [Oscillospiraceae bacterium]|nr:hypothetical protein [Oscillospiraceae bacterium]
MSFLSKLLGIGAVAGATVAAMKVSEKYKQNNPDGLDSDGDGKVDVNDVVTEVTKAATEVYNDASEKAKDVAASAKQKAGELYEQAPEMLEKVKKTAKDAFNSVTNGEPEAPADEEPPKTEE